MSNFKPRDLARSDKPNEIERNVRDLTQRQSSAPHRANNKGEQASAFMDRFTLESTCEIDRLIDDLMKLRQRLENDGSRVQRDIADYSSLCQSVIQLTKIVSDSMVHVKRVSDAPSTASETQIPAFLTAIPPQQAQ